MYKITKNLILIVTIFISTIIAPIQASQKNNLFMLFQNIRTLVAKVLQTWPLRNLCLPLYVVYMVYLG